MINITSGSLDDFFDSALETAVDIDKDRTVTPKHTIWMEIDDLSMILKPSRTALIKYLREKEFVYYSVVLEDLKKSPSSLNKDLELLAKYELINISKEINSGHGVKKVIKPLYKDETLEFRAAV